MREGGFGGWWSCGVVTTSILLLVLILFCWSREVSATAVALTL